VRGRDVFALAATRRAALSQRATTADFRCEFAKGASHPGGPQEFFVIDRRAEVPLARKVRRDEVRGSRVMKERPWFQINAFYRRLR